MTSEIDDRVPKVADCEAGTEDKTARAVKHEHLSAPEGQRTDPSLNSGGSRRRIFKRSVRCGGKGFPSIYSHFWVKRLFWWRANRTQHCILEKLFPNRLCAGFVQTITLLSLKGPSGHIFKRLEGEGCIFFVCIYVFLWLEMAYLMLISLLRHA